MYSPREGEWYSVPYYNYIGGDTEGVPKKAWTANCLYVWQDGDLWFFFPDGRMEDEFYFYYDEEE